MNRSPQGLAVIEIRGGAWLPGCARGPGGEKSAGRPGESFAKERRSKPASETSEESAERRVRAIAHFGAGISAELNDDDTAALEHYLKSAAADPGHEALVLELARRFLQNKQVDKAIDLLAKATASPRASGKMLAWLGLAYAEAGKTDLAIQADQAAIKQSPHLLLGYRNLFSIYHVNRQPRQAVKVVVVPCSQFGGAPQFWIEL